MATEELRYGDNDRLSARVAQMIQSDLLILLSDVDGVYTADPGCDHKARHVPHISAITDEIEQWAGGTSGTGVGSGGMRTKLAAAKIARTFGCATIIASGHEQRPLSRLLTSEARATVIDAAGSPARAYKQWIAGSLVAGGKRQHRWRGRPSARLGQEPAPRWSHRARRGIRAGRVPARAWP